MRRSIVSASLGALLLLSTAANAIPVTYDFSGTVTRFGFNNFNDPSGRERILGLLPGSLSNPDQVLLQPQVLGSVTLDADAAMDVDFDWDPSTSLFPGFDVLSAFSVSIAGIDLALDPAVLGSGASVFVQPLSQGLDVISVGATLGAGALPGAASILTPLFSLDGERVNGNAFPGAFPTDLTALLNPRFRIDFFDFRNLAGVSYFAEVNSLTRRATVAGTSSALLDSSTERVTVPETSTPLLFGLGMLGLLYGTTRRHSKTRPRAV